MTNILMRLLYSDCLNSVKVCATEMAERYFRNDVEGFLFIS